MSKIFLDPGHGGSDPGATGNGLQEKNVVLDIAKHTRDYLQNNYSGINVRMSRTGDSFPSLTDRTNASNNWGADIFVSIHINAFNGSAHGYEDFVFNGSISSNTRSLQNSLHNQIAPLFRNNRGKKRANFAVLRQSNMPAVLTENGFIDNKQDADFLKSDNNLKKIAEAHAKGIASYLGLSGGSSSGGSTSSGSSSSGSGAPRYNGQTFAQAHSDWWMKKRSETEEAQRLLNQHGYNLAVDGILGQKTLNAVRDYQDKHGISYNGANFYGVPGPATRKHLRDNSSSSSVAKPTLRNGSRGNEVEKLQRQLNNHSPRFNPRGVDGIYGANTADAVLRYQKQYGVRPYDGIYGSKTANKLKETI